MLLFLKLYLSHLVADFLLQPNWIVKDKARASRLFLHSAIHIATTVAIINTALNKKILLAILILAFSHAICDYVKAKLTRDEWLAFTIDQATHLLIIMILSIWLSAEGWKNAEMILHVIVGSQKLYLYLCVYVAVIFGGGYFVQKITLYFMNQIDKALLQSKPGLRNAGKYIGWLERALVTTFIVAGYPEGIGLLLAAKAVARYPDIKSDEKFHFAEYFLVGTLTSVSIALLAGFVLLKLKSRIGN
jgi:hypothetical protein